MNEKKFNHFKTKDGYLLLAIDGVQTISTNRKIEHAIYKEHSNGTKTYHQYFLEAKIVSTDGFVFSIDTEIIENLTEQFDKQDCEQKAAYRLLKRIKKEHPHLKFRILGDGLYCNSVIMDICDSYRWKYAITFKGETQYPKLLGEINAEINYEQRDNKFTYTLKKNSTTEIYIELRWCNNLIYAFGKNGEREVNYLSAKVIRIKNGERKEITTFSYLLSEAVSKSNALQTLMNCRKRWKIENEGFNFQKNNILNISHNYSSIGYASLNFYLLAQIAHTIIQLAYFTNIAGYVRRAITSTKDNLSQSLKSIFNSFSIVAGKVKTDFFNRVFKPPKLPVMRIKLKFA